MENQTQTAAPQVLTRSLVKKITTKVVAGKLSLEALIEHNTAHPGTVMPLYTLYGIASDMTAGETALGPYVKILGQFKAVNVKGETFVSGCAIIPGAGSDLIASAVKSLGDNGGNIEFAFKIGAKRDLASAVGYVYEVEQMQQPGQSDPLAALENRLGGLKLIGSGSSDADKKQPDAPNAETKKPDEKKKAA